MSTNGQRLIDAIPSQWRIAPSESVSEQCANRSQQVQMVSAAAKRLVDAIPEGMRQNPNITFVASASSVQASHQAPTRTARTSSTFVDPSAERALQAHAQAWFGGRLKLEKGVMGG